MKESTIPTSSKRRNIVAGIVLPALVCIGVVRILSTYPVFSQTADEPAHVATGMEWLERGAYTFEPLHPPLSRVAVALGLYLSGVRLTGKTGIYAEGNELLFAQGRYSHNLALARLGTLPFFVLAAFLVWLWCRGQHGDGAAFVALLLFTTCPVVLAHAGLATTDMALTATFTGSLFAFVRFLEQPTYKQSAILGIATGAAVLSKFSALAFLPACAAAVLACRWWLLRRTGKARSAAAGRPRWCGPLAIAALATCLVIWAGYRFSLGSLVNRTSRPYTSLDRLVGSKGALHDLAYSVAESSWVPAPAFFQGIEKVHDKNSSGHKGYLLGQIRQTGWWYFFPVALAVKTPVPLLILVAAGIFYLARSAWAKSDWVIAVPAVAACVLIVVCLPSQINIGVRHLLPIYPLFAVIGGAGAAWLWNRATLRPAGPALVMFLLVWQITASARIHPDYLAYFNEFADKHPERILIDSDLDWGQDLLRLSTALRERHIEEVSIAYAGSAGLDLSRFGLPSFRILEPNQPTSGWIAISMLRLKEGGLGFPDDSFAWLEAYEPVSLVGRSIRLYYIK